MYRGTTPVLKFVFDSEDLDFDKIEECWISFENNETTTFTKDDIGIDASNKTIILEMSQEDTFKFSGSVGVQIRILTDDGRAWATPIKKVKFDRVIKGGVISAK